MIVWIDLNSGTWGEADGLVFVDLGNPELHDKDTDEHSLLAFLDSASDQEIINFGNANGSERP